jgi:hypothetical protein
MILFKGKIIFFSFIRFLDLFIKRMLCLLFSKVKEYSTKTYKAKKKTSSLRYNNPSLLKGFMRFLTGSSCEILLEIENLNNMWFAIT